MTFANVENARADSCLHSRESINVVHFPFNVHSASEKKKKNTTARLKRIDDLSLESIKKFENPPIFGFEFDLHTAMSTLRSFTLTG